MILQRFYNDEATREVVKQFLTDYLKEKTIDLAFSGKGTEHISLARDVIEEAWNKLEKEYGKKEDKQKENPAR